MSLSIPQWQSVGLSASYPDSPRNIILGISPFLNTIIFIGVPSSLVFLSHQRTNQLELGGALIHLNSILSEDSSAPTHNVQGSQHRHHHILLTHTQWWSLNFIIIGEEKIIWLWILIYFLRFRSINKDLSHIMPFY